MKLIMEFGGKCSVCGYNKNISALDFHHKESFIKSFQLDKRNVLYRKKLDSKNDGKSFEITEIV